ncbi:hypothetical protein Q8A64_12145 [Oxalobacteraceae bacterium R-40]|uniref:Uncharacterized protein n=1 Tax=Keguizhuia sedimenti TaxID=3064264 RepID=A0ABU1BQ83_9BURK|nr:hypothetical protein [Oxalobacteraceae bacterium R-40]
MKKGRNPYAVDKAGSKHEKHRNTKRFPQGTDKVPSSKTSESKAQKNS